MCQSNMSVEQSELSAPMTRNCHHPHPAKETTTTKMVVEKEEASCWLYTVDEMIF